jgi:hypothetical protein
MTAISGPEEIRLNMDLIKTNRKGEKGLNNPSSHSL